ncbi:MAG: RIP metalloprotease RseP [Spirochaetes bacterium]|nr:RIP metalloprotease RseP [Spirochaetota bacterium]
MVTFTYIISAIVLLGLCIFVHELGHLLGGRMVGIKAKIFSLGYGKGFIKKKIGDTTYQITLIPFGGYCQFYGEDPAEERIGKEYEFLTAHPMKRVLTVAMGPIFNLIFGIILFFVMNLVGYTKETNRVMIPEELTSGKNISPAYSAGIRNGDRITEINGKTVTGFADIQSGVIFSNGKPVKITARRGAEDVAFSVAPKVYEEGGRYTIGVVPYGERVLIAGLLQNDVAEKAGLREMDEIKSIDGVPIKTPAAFTDYIKARSGKKVVLNIVRTGRGMDLAVTPRANEMVVFFEADSAGGPEREMTFDRKIIEKNISKRNIKLNGRLVANYDDFLSTLKREKGKKITIENKNDVISGRAEIQTRGFVGVYPAIAPEMVEVRYSLGDGMARAITEPYDFIVMNLKGMGMLFSGRMNVRENLSGPIRIAKIAGDVAYYQGISAFVILMAKISIILMVMNLLPIPVVDGSMILFFLLEAARGKPLNQKVMERIQTVGIVLLIMLGVFVVINDISMLPIIQRIIN